MKDTPVSTKAIIIDSKDNVASLLSTVAADETVPTQLGEDVLEFKMKEPIQFGHKFAIRNIPEGELVIKYGETIGRAVRDIEKGCHVHVNNVESLRGRGDLS